MASNDFQKQNKSLIFAAKTSQNPTFKTLNGPDFEWHPNKTFFPVLEWSDLLNIDLQNVFVGLGFGSLMYF